MTDKNYLSDVFKDDELVGGDIDNSLIYKFIKSYPSINSTNGGQTHSEENVRWLTRQFTKKPFIIPYTDNESFDEFWYEGAVLNAGRTNGGMANIDGYIINMADTTTKTSFDNTEDTALSTGGPSGYIMHQRLQRAVGEVLSQLSSDVTQYLSYLSSINLQKLMLTLSYNYKKSKGEDVSDIDTSTIYTDLSNILPGESNNAIFVKAGEYIITYTGTLGEYIYNNFNVTTLATDYSDIIKDVRDISTTELDENNNTIIRHGYGITYYTFFGIIDDKLHPIKNETTNNYISSLYIRDILGLYFIWQADDSRVVTNSYPSTLDTNINFLDDTMTPQDPGGNILRGLALSQTKLYDCSTTYLTVDDTDPDYNYFINKVNTLGATTGSIYEGLSKTAINVRTDTTNPTLYNLADYYQATCFDVVNASDIIDLFQYYNGGTAQESDFTRDAYHTGALYYLSDSYYCLPLDRLSNSCKSLLCHTVNNEPIEVGFMTSSGALMARNYEYTVVENGVIVHKIFIEGYVSFFRRLVATLLNIDYEATMPNPNDYNSPEWNQLLKDFQLGTYTVDKSVLSVALQMLLEDIFGASTIITFELLYNTFLAPYMNLHIQTAWSSLYDLNVDCGSVSTSKYKTRWGYNILNDNLSEITDPTPIIVDDKTAMIGEHWQQYPHVNLQINHTYANTSWSVPKYLSYFYNQDTDNGRLSSYLAENEYSELAEGFETYIAISDLDAITNKYSLCEDYITFLKNCSCRGWDDTYNPNSVSGTNLINVKYKVTNLTINAGMYGFNITNKIVDRVAKFVNFDTSGAENNTKYINFKESDVTPAEFLLPIEAGYINNVAIRLDTLCPWRQDYDNNTFVYPYNENDTDIPVGQINPTLSESFNLWLTAYSTIEYDQAQTIGLSGYSFTGRSQGMVTYVPMLFRLYKDSQNYLNGIKCDGTNTHAGIFIDYKFPRDVNTTDFWFANTWLSNIAWVTAWEIESHAASAPTSTDSMYPYLNIRNKTILSVDQIYDIDEDGNYITLEAVVNTYIVNNNESLQQEIDAVDIRLTQEVDNPEFVFNKAIPTPENNDEEQIDLIYGDSTVTGLENGIKALQEDINHLTNTYEEEVPVPDEVTHIVTVELENNKYLDLKNTITPILKLTFAKTFADDIDNFKKGIDTQKSKLFKSTVRITIGSSAIIDLDNSVYNQVTHEGNYLNNRIPIKWTSNYNIIDCSLRIGEAISTEETYSVTSDYITIYNTINNTTMDIIVDVEISYNDTLNIAEATCNISTINDANTLTIYDMAYILRANYALSELTWTQVSNLTKMGMASKLWSLGDIKTFKLNYTDPDTQESTFINIPAMIIGFNQDGPNTITWMTRQNTTDNFGPVLTGRFPCEMGTSYNDGYNNTIENSSVYNPAPVWEWLNGQTNSICQAVDSEMKTVILPARKITRPLYVVKDDVTNTYHEYQNNNGYYKNYRISFYTNDYNDYEVPENTYDKYREYGNYNTPVTESGGDPFWLPSIYELGLSATALDNSDNYIDEAEGTAYENAIDENSTHYISTASQYATLRSYPHGSNMYTDCIEGSVITYDYFKLPESKQDVLSPFISRDYYAVRSDDVTGTFDEDTSDDVYTKYATANRTMYVVETVPNEDDITKRHYGIQDRATASLPSIHLTGFCFITH